LYYKSPFDRLRVTTCGAKPEIPNNFSAASNHFMLGDSLLFSLFSEHERFDQYLEHSDLVSLSSQLLTHSFFSCGRLPDASDATMAVVVAPATTIADASKRILRI
jgi:hypothetical protein